MWAISDNNSTRCLSSIEIGFGFVLVGVGLYFLGVLFICDRALLLLGNVSSPSISP